MNTYEIPLVVPFQGGSRETEKKDVKEGYNFSKKASLFTSSAILGAVIGYLFTREPYSREYMQEQLWTLYDASERTLRNAEEAMLYPGRFENPELEENVQRGAHNILSGTADTIGSIYQGSDLLSSDLSYVPNLLRSTVNRYLGGDDDNDNDDFGEY